MEETKGFVDIGLVGFTDKGEYNPESIYMMNDIVHRDNGLWRCLIDHTTGIEPEENHNWTIFIQSTKELRGITAIDTKGILGPEGETVSAQELAEKLSAPEFEDFSQEGATVPGARTAISQILSGIPVPKIFSKIKAALMGLVTLGEIQAYLVNNGLCTEAGKYFLDAAYGKTLKEAIDSTNSNLLKLGRPEVIIPTTDYQVGVEYTANTDPLDFIYYIPYVNWVSFQMVFRQWKDDTFEQIPVYGFFGSDDFFEIITFYIDINKNTKKLKIRDCNIFHAYSSGNFALIKPQSLSGVQLQGIRF